MNISYRVLKPSESRIYRTIRLEALSLNPEAYSSNYEAALLQPRMFFEAAVESGSRMQWVMGAFDGEELIGIFAYSDENSLAVPEAGTLLQMYVRDSYRGQGIGQELTRNILKEVFKFHSVKQVLLEVKVGNEAAKAVYIKAGFVAHALEGLTDESQSLTILRADLR